eukprot:jgi/Tetstr1/463971/TSEL_008776.t1
MASNARSSRSNAVSVHAYLKSKYPSLSPELDAIDPTDRRSAKSKIIQAVCKDKHRDIMDDIIANESLDYKYHDEIVNARKLKKKSLIEIASRNGIVDVDREKLMNKICKNEKTYKDVVNDPDINEADKKALEKFRKEKMSLQEVVCFMIEMGLNTINKKATKEQLFEAIIASRRKSMQHENDFLAHLRISKVLKKEYAGYVPESFSWWKISVLLFASLMVMYSYAVATSDGRHGEIQLYSVGDGYSALDVAQKLASVVVTCVVVMYATCVKVVDAHAEVFQAVITKIMHGTYSVCVP